MRRYDEVDVYGYAVFHKSWSKLEAQGTKYYHDNKTPAPDETERDPKTGKTVRNQTSLDTRDWTWDASDWFHRSRPGGNDDTRALRTRPRTHALVRSFNILRSLDVRAAL